MEIIYQHIILSNLIPDDILHKIKYDKQKDKIILPIFNIHNDFFIPRDIIDCIVNMNCHNCLNNKISIQFIDTIKNIEKNIKNYNNIYFYENESLNPYMLLNKDLLNKELKYNKNIEIQFINKSLYDSEFSLL